MRFRACIALLLFVSACATSAPTPRAPAAWNPRLANLQRAAKLPWTDGGRCAVREASEPWPMLVEQCFHALDHDRLEFHDPSGRCAVASAGAAAVGLGVCVLAAPELVGVRSAAHKAALELADTTLKVVIMDWCAHGGRPD